MDEFYDILSFYGVNIENVEDKLGRMNSNDLYSMVNSCNEVIIKQEPPQNSKYNFTANYQLSGGTFPCKSYGCRKKNIDDLAKFSILYADNVILPNFLSRYKESLFDFSTLKKEEYIKSNVINDIKLLYHVRPLIDSKLFYIGLGKNDVETQYYNMEISKGDKFLKKMKKIRLELINEFINSTTVNINPNDKSEVILNSNMDFFPHGGKLLALLDSEEIKKFGTYKNISKFNASLKKAVFKEELYKFAIDPLISDILYHNLYSTIYNAQYVTSREIDFKVLSKINENMLNVQALIDGISHSAPYIINADIESLIELRDTERDSFILYRDALNSVLNTSKNLTSDKIRQAFNDIVAPELAGIDKSIKKHRKSLVKGIGKDAIICGCFITIGLFSGVMDKEFAKIIAGLGGFGFFQSTANKIFELFNSPDGIEESKYYFLWKANNN